MLVKHRHVLICILFLFRCRRRPPSINGSVCTYYLLLLTFSTTMYSRIPYWYGSKRRPFICFYTRGKNDDDVLFNFLPYFQIKLKRLLVLWLAILLLTADWPGLA